MVNFDPEKIMNSHGIEVTELVASEQIESGDSDEKSNECLVCL